MKRKICFIRNWCRDEIKEGMEDFLDRYGCSKMKELLEES